MRDGGGDDPSIVGKRNWPDGGNPSCRGRRFGRKADGFPRISEKQTANSDKQEREELECGGRVLQDPTQPCGTDIPKKAEREKKEPHQALRFQCVRNGKQAAKIVPSRAGYSGDKRWKIKKHLKPSNAAREARPDKFSCVGNKPARLCGARRELPNAQPSKDDSDRSQQKNKDAKRYVAPCGY